LFLYLSNQLGHVIETSMWFNLMLGLGKELGHEFQL